MRQSVEGLTLSDKGIAALAASEGIVPAIYLDSVGVETFGIGVTKWAIGQEAMDGLPVAMPVDVEGVVRDAVEMFRRVVVQYEDAVRDAVTVPLSQHEYDALVHFVYNVGAPNFKRSKLLINLNSGRYKAAGETGFHGWLKPPELRGRRDYESDIFLTGDYGAKRIPIFKTNGAKKLAGRHSVMGQARFLDLIGKPQPIIQPPAPEPLPEPVPLAQAASEARGGDPVAAPVPHEVMALIDEADSDGSSTLERSFAAKIRAAVQGGGGAGMLGYAAGAWEKFSTLPWQTQAIIAAVAVGACILAYLEYRDASKNEASRLKKGQLAKIAKAAMQ